MNAVEQAIRQAIEQKTKALNEITALLDANPYAEIMKLEESVLAETKRLFVQGKHDDALGLLQKADAERKRLIGVAKAQEDTLALIQQRVDLTMDIADLNSEVMKFDIRRARYS